MARSDAQLVHATLAGDREAFGALVDRHRRAVFALALQRGLQPAEAEDVAQEVFIKAYRSLGELKQPDAFARWLYGIASHVGADQARVRQRRHRESGLDGLDEPAAPPHDRVTQALGEERERILRALGELDEAKRVVITMRYLEGLTPKEIAERLGEPRGTVRSRLHHALSYLQAAFGTVRSPEGPEA